MTEDRGPVRLVGEDLDCGAKLEVAELFQNDSPPLALPPVYNLLTPYVFILSILLLEKPYLYIYNIHHSY